MLHILYKATRFSEARFLTKVKNDKPLRDTCCKLKLDHPLLQRQVLIALAVKAMNDTLGPKGIDPSSLVFGEFPNLRSLVGPDIARPLLAERAMAAQEALHLMAKNLAQLRISRA